MRDRLNVRYRDAAEEFAARAVSELRGQVNSIVLFGSVARRRAMRDSDVDLLVVAASPNIRDRAFDIAYEVMEATRFEAFLSVVYLSRNEFRHLARTGNPFICSVLEEGSVLYDDGTFARVREEAA